MGTDTPPSFLGQDLLPWLVNKGLCGDQDHRSANVCVVSAHRERTLTVSSTGQCVGGKLPSNFLCDILGMVRVGRLYWTGKPRVAQGTVFDGYLSVRVDRHSSHVGNPFISAPTARLCHAYNELLRAVLTVPISVDECLHEYEGMRQDTFPTSMALSAAEEVLLNHISEKYHVSVFGQFRVRPLAVRPWLVHHALLLLQGQHLQLDCWCACGSPFKISPWACHAQLLAGALLWLVCTQRDTLLATFNQVDSLNPPLHVTRPFMSKHTFNWVCILPVSQLEASAFTSCWAVDPPLSTPCSWLCDVRPVGQACHSRGTLHLQPFRAMLSQEAAEFHIPLHSAPFMRRVARVILALGTGDGAHLAIVHSIGRVRRLAAMGASTVALGELHWAVRPRPCGEGAAHTPAQDGKSGSPSKLCLNFQAACCSTLWVSCLPFSQLETFNRLLLGDRPPIVSQTAFGHCVKWNSLHSPPFSSCTVSWRSIILHMAHMALCWPVFHGYCIAYANLSIEVAACLHT